MANYDAGTIDVRGQDMAVQVNNSGTWLCTWQGTEYRADTKEALRHTMLNVTKRRSTKVAVRFTEVKPRLSFGSDGGYRFINGTATGLHAGNGNILVTWSTGKTDQIDARRGRGGHVRRLTPDEVEEAKVLLAAKDAAAAAWEAWRSERAVVLRDEVDEAITTAITAERPEGGQ